jgi:hypothetical protein
MSACNLSITEHIESVRGFNAVDVNHQSLLSTPSDILELTPIIMEAVMYISSESELDSELRVTRNTDGNTRTSKGPKRRRLGM